MLMKNGKWVACRARFARKTVLYISCLRKKYEACRKYRYTLYTPALYTYRYLYKVLVYHIEIEVAGYSRFSNYPSITLRVYITVCDKFPLFPFSQSRMYQPFLDTGCAIYCYTDSKSCSPLNRSLSALKASAKTRSFFKGERKWISWKVYS